MRARPAASLGLFVGRDRELERVHQLSGERLVTIRGTAGIGKTRLIAEYLRRAAKPHVFVDLTEATTAGALESCVFRALGVAPGAADRDGGAAHVLAAAGEHLLVLDNFEQLVPGGSLVVARWLAAARALRIVVTSRVDLGIPGEVVLELGPLAPPRADADPLACDAGRLLVDRAQRARADYRVDGAEAARVADVLRALEGIPLAIEIVAPRLARFGGEAVRQRLAERLRWGGASRQTLGDAIDASWQLLEESERRALASCSVFRGGFDLEAAEAIVTPSGSPWSALDVLDALASKSLVRVGDVENDKPGGRFDLFLSVRDWVGAQLAPDDARALEARHAAHYAARARRAAADALGPEAVDARRWLSRERENLHAAARSGHAARDDAARCLLALEIVATTEGPLAPYADDVGALLARGECDAELALELRIVHAQVLQKLGRPGAAEEAARAVEDARAHPALEAAALFARGCVELAEGALDRAVDTLEAGIASAARSSRHVVEASCWASLGAALAGRGDLAAARAAVERARHLHVATGNLREEAMSSAFLGNLCIDEGRLAEGEVHFAYASTILAEIGDRFAEAFVLANLAMLHHRGGQLERAIEEYGAALDGFARVGARRYLGAFEGYRALAERSRGSDERAIEGLARATEQLRAARDARFEAFFTAMWAAIELERGVVDPAAARLAQAAALLEPIRDPMLAIAVSLPRAVLARARARAAELRGDRASADGHEREARDVLGAASRPGPDGRAPRDSSFEVFLAERACDGDHGPRLAPPPSRTRLAVAADGSWIAAPRAPRVGLDHRGSLKQMLAALVAARGEQPGKPVSREALQAAGWPGERMRAAAAANRVRVGLATLRRLGLRDVLRTEPTGWLLDPDAELDVLAPDASA